MGRRRSIDKYDTVAGWVFEKYAARMLAKQRTRQLIRIHPESSLSTTTLDLPENALQYPEKANYDSIDGWYWNQANFICFSLRQVLCIQSRRTASLRF